MRKGLRVEEGPNRPRNRSEEGQRGLGVRPEPRSRAETGLQIPGPRVGPRWMGLESPELTGADLGLESPESMEKLRESEVDQGQVPTRSSETGAQGPGNWLIDLQGMGLSIGKDGVHAIGP